MTVARAVYITGCKESWGPTVIVDVDEPEKTGKGITGGSPLCYINDNHLENDVQLESIPTGKIIYDDAHRGTAGVVIICHENRCPLHNSFLPENTDKLHTNPESFVDVDIRDLRPEVIDFIISDGKFLETTTIGYRLNQLVTSFKLMKDVEKNNPSLKQLLSDNKRWIFTDDPNI